jgi:2-keto-3-deoxy-L-rhamnonate aldolase RhmA
MTATFRQRLRAGEVVTACFIKTPAFQHVEIAGASGLDAVVLDTEHASFDPSQLDVCLLAARAAGTAGLVRLADQRPETALHALDLGAAGVVVPHVKDAATARAVVAMCRYRGGDRGFSNSPRAGGYGAIGMADHVAASDDAISVICQIEDASAIEHVAAIAAVPGVDCLFIGRADLALSFGLTQLDHPRVDAAIATIIEAGQAAGVAVGIFLPDDSTVDSYARRGVTCFVIGSDQSWLRSAATQLADRQSRVVAIPARHLADPAAPSELPMTAMMDMASSVTLWRQL